MFESKTSVARWLWTHNPFYIISSLLMLYGVRAGYANVEIGTINCWIMMGILGAYTVLLASIGILIIRWGKVWDDARAVLLLVLLLFLAVSVSADDLFVKMESLQGGTVLMASGFVFSVVILLGILVGARIRLGLVYVVPLILFLALFFAAPWWCSPELHPQDAVTLDWTLFLFPQVAAAILLTLIPAARLGWKSVQNNGTPWPWPLFPWSAFVFIGVAVVLRSYALTMTFSPSGPIWTSPDSRSGIVFDTIWRPYFLVPFAMAALILLVEAGLASGNRRVVGRGLLLAPGLLLMAWPWNPSESMSEFLNSMTGTLGSPVWLTVWFLAIFYGAVRLRGVVTAEIGLFGSILMLSVVGPGTINAATFTDLNPLPSSTVGLVLGVVGLRRGSSILILLASGLITAAVSAFLPGTQLAGFRMTICFHMMLAACVLLSIFGTDAFAKGLQSIAALLMMVSAITAFGGASVSEIPVQWRIGYVAALSLICFVCLLASQSFAYRSGFIITTSVFGYAISIEGFRFATSIFGRNATTAFSWSAGSLIIGVLISAHKAHWLPPVTWTGLFGPPGPQPESGPVMNLIDPVTPVPE